MACKDPRQQLVEPPRPHPKTRTTGICQVPLGAPRRTKCANCLDCPPQYLQHGMVKRFFHVNLCQQDRFVPLRRLCMQEHRSCMYLGALPAGPECDTAHCHERLEHTSPTVQSHCVDHFGRRTEHGDRTVLCGQSAPEHLRAKREHDFLERVVLVVKRSLLATSACELVNTSARQDTMRGARRDDLVGDRVVRSGLSPLQF